MQQTHQLRSAALSAFRASASSLRAPANKRFFTPSAYNMAIKSYFDVQWEGPEVEVDKSGNVTSKGAAKSKLLFLLPLHVHPSTSPCV
jgi:peptidylprolyl isomerase